MTSERQATPARGSDRLVLACLIAATAAALLVAIRPALAGFNGHDAVWHLTRIAQWHRGVTEGVLYPRYLHDVYWGRGGPVMIFCPPLPYALTELLSLAGAGPSRALFLATALAFVLALGAFHLFARPALGTAAALVAAAAWTIAPYHLMDAWVRAAYPELLAMAALPLLLYAARRAAEGRDGPGIVGLALSAALLILTHNVTAVFGLPLALAYGVWHAAAPGGSRALRLSAAARVLAGVAGGVGLAAFYWLPALMERAYTLIPETFRDAPFQPTDHLLSVGQLFVGRPGFGHSGPGAGDGMNFAVGWIHLAALGGAALIAWRRPVAARREILFWLPAVVVSASLTLTPTAWLWDHMPLLPLIQFPWRLLMIAALGSSFCVGALCLPAGGAAPWRRALAAAGLIVVMTASYLPFAAALPPGHDDDDFTPEALAGSMGAEPMWFPKGAPWGRRSPRVAVVSGGASVEVIEDITHRLAARVTAAGPATVRVGILAYPGWGAFVDGAAAPARTDEQADILVDVPAGEHELVLSFGLTPLRRLAAWASVLSLALLAAALRRW